MAWSLRLRSPPAAGESGQAKQRFVLALAAVGLTLGLLLAAVSVYAIWTNTTSVTPNFDSDTLDPGTGLIAFPSGSNIVISWTASVDTYATGYKVLRSTTSGGPYTEIDTVTPIAATIYTDTSVVVDTTYYYVLQSYYQNWLSADSNQGSATAGAGLVSIADSYVQEDLAGSNFGTATLMDLQSYTAGQTTSLTSVADSYGQEDLADTNFGTTTSMDVQSDDDIVTTSFAAVADSYVQEDLADSSFGAATLMDVQTFQDGGSKENRRSLVQFNVSSIPAGSTVTAATLTLCAAVVPGSTRTNDVHRVTAVWDETVTWNNQPTVVPQKVSASTPATPACMTWTVTADVQLWVDGTANNGWRIEDANEGSNILHLAQYRTREESVVTAERPDLDVTYTAPTQQNRRSFVQFDVTSIPAGSTVNSATLTLCATAVPAATRTYEVHQVTAGWVEGSITWNNQPGVGALTDTATTPATPGCMTWTVTADVQLWVDGTANNGWRVNDATEASATQYLTQFRTKEDGAVPAEQPKLDVTYSAPSDQKNRRSFVQFDVSTIPANSNVTFATLTLCATAVPAATRTYELHQVTAAWVETSINWTNQPAVAATATATKTTPATPGCMTWIVTADVQAWVNGTANNGWRIFDATEASATQYLSQFRTREEAVVTSDRPKLAVNINAPQDTSFVSTADSYGQEDLADTNFGAATSMDVQSQNDVVTTSFAAGADSYVQEDLADSSFGAATLMDVQSFQDGGSKENRRSLAQFDVSSIPAGSTVTTATLTLCATVVPAASRTYDVHLVTAGWDESTVTWNNQPSVLAQKVSAATPATPGCMSWTMTDDVQDWVDGTANNGWRIEDSNEGAVGGHLSQFRTREDGAVPAEQPKLDVTYTALTQQNRRSFVQFDVSSIPAGSNVNSATLTLCATAVPSATRTYDAYRVTTGWLEGTITWNNQPAVAGAATATNTTPATPGCMTWNIANDVQLWVDGTANDGWRIHDVSENSATQYLTQFRTKEDGAVPAEQPKLDVNYTEPWESVSESVAAGGTVTTDTEADGATAADQLETWVTSPNAGTVTIIERAATPSPPPEFTFLGQEVNITAPNATAADPLVIRFRLDATLVPPGEDENTIAIFKDGVLVPNCDTFPGSTTAAPDPCVTDRVLLGDSDVEITVLTSTASGWNFGVPAAAVCSTADTGFQSPTAQASDTGGDGNGFELNPTNAFADDAAFASNIDGQDDRHRFSGYDFSSASGCTIQGIEVRFDWWLDSISGTSSMDVELSWDGGTSWTQPRNDPLETDTEHTITFGGSIDLWGHAWSVSDLSSTNFRVRLTSNSTSTTRDFFLDWVSVKVYFGPTASDSGYLSPSAEVADTGGDGDGFELNPTNAFADDAAFASSMNNSVDRHRYYNFGASIPAGSTINGIEVRLDWWMDDILGTNSMDVELSWDGGTSWTAIKVDITETTTEHTFSLGGPADAWGRTWTDSEFSDANFRVRLTSNSSSGFRDFFLDWVAVRVYYTP